MKTLFFSRIVPIFALLTLFIILAVLFHRQTFAENTDRNSLMSDPNKINTLDFDQNPVRAPVVTLADQEKSVFVGEPVTLKIKEVFDPDGKCQIFQYDWQKPKRMQVENVKIENKLGDLFFVPKSTGVFTIRVQATELCKELGTLSSELSSVRVMVRDKASLFSDISEAPQYQNAIYTLYHEGAMKGYPDRSIRPNSSINRAEFLKMVFQTIQFKILETVFSPRYSDVSPVVWYAPYVSQAGQMGVIKGYPDGKFHPERAINLAEALKIVLHFTSIKIMDADQYSFLDVKNEDWFSRYVQTAFREGIVDPPRSPLGSGEDLQRKAFPGKVLTRGEAAQIIVRTFLYPVNRINQVNKDAVLRPDEFEDFSEFTK